MTVTIAPAPVIPETRPVDHLRAFLLADGVRPAVIAALLAGRRAARGERVPVS